MLEYHWHCHAQNIHSGIHNQCSPQSNGVLTSDIIRQAKQRHLAQEEIIVNKFNSVY